MPLRFVLRYDPVFLELARRLASGEWGGLTGISVSAVLGSHEKERELLSFLILLFGRPPSALRTVIPHELTRSIFMYGTFALSLECVVAGEALLYGRDAAISGSMSCTAAFVEFRLGSDRFLAAARDESHFYRASMAEGDGERYRSLDESKAGGPVVVGEAADLAATAAADLLFSTGELR
jgi:hypothetical protein